MTLVVRGDPGRLRSSVAFSLSGCLHATLLVWLVLASAMARVEKPRSLYDQEIRPLESHLIWYNLRDRLPEVQPSTALARPKPQRAKKKFNQEIVVGAKELPRPPQLIQAPAPEIALSKPLALPNILAAAAVSRPVRGFTPPPDKQQPAPRPEVPLPDAPKAPAAAPKDLPLPIPGPRPQAMPFTPPMDRRPRTTQAEVPVPDAPKVTAATAPKDLALPMAGPRPQALPFTPPTDRRPRTTQSDITLPEAPISSTPAPASLALPVAAPRLQALPFTPPATRKAPPQSPDLPSAPVVVGGGGGVPAEMPRIPKGFAVPASRKATAPATAVAGLDTGAAVVGSPAAGPLSDISLAIVGLNPANTADIPAPPNSHQAGFSAGPKPRAEGSESSAKDALLTVPGLSTHGGARESQPTLVATLAPLTRQRMAEMTRADNRRTTAAEAPGAAAATLRTAPDPRLAGRVVYTVAIQMPNITSYSGSWLAWFAEHRPLPGAPPLDMRPPVALRKVDPKYIQAAADEKVQGVIRLYAVIRRNGTVDSVELIQSLDQRLDRSAQEALVKWQFEPARRDGTPVDVDAVFEIPFRLAPRLPK